MKPSVAKSLLCFIFIVSQFIAAPAIGQPEHYTTRKTHNTYSHKLIKQLNQMLKGDFKRMRKSAHRLQVAEINAERKKNLVKSVQSKMFINDDTLETLVNGVMLKVVQDNNLEGYQRRVLVSRDPTPTASCYGRGIYIVTVGMIARTYNEHQLAFVIAHEVAHDELDHIRKKILNEDNFDISKKRLDNTIKAVKGKTVSEEDQEDLRKLIYGVRSFNRKSETQADSMAILLMRNAGYDVRQINSALSMLEEYASPKYDIGAELYMPINLDTYPLKTEWLNDRGYADLQFEQAGMSADSLKTHPEISLRVKIVNEYLQRYNFPAREPASSEFALDAITLAEFETLLCTRDRKQYVYGIYQALQLLNRYPRNPFLIGYVAEGLINIHEWKANRFNVPKSFYRYTMSGKASEELQLLNTIIANLSAEESGEMAYHFISSKGNFDENTRNHYQLRYRICQLTSREQESVKLKQEFRRRFNGAL